MLKFNLTLPNFIFIKKNNEAEFYLNKILQTPNSDWRACFRSLVLLLLIEDKPKKSRFFKDLKISNPNFPIELITEYNYV